MPDSYKELIKSNPDETEIRSFLVVPLRATAL